MKTYSLEYDCLGCRLSLQTQSISQLFDWFEKALINPHAIQSSITLTTQEKDVSKK
jgi:hypothetical protein